MKKKLPPAPVFDTPEEEDEFWQTHSPLEFEHEEVGIPPKRKLQQSTFETVTDRLKGAQNE